MAFTVKSAVDTAVFTAWSDTTRGAEDGMSFEEWEGIVDPDALRIHCAYRLMPDMPELEDALAHIDVSGWYCEEDAKDHLSAAGYLTQPAPNIA